MVCLLKFDINNNNNKYVQIIEVTKKYDHLDIDKTGQAFRLIRHIWSAKANIKSYRVRYGFGASFLRPLWLKP